MMFRKMEILFSFGRSDRTNKRSTLKIGRSGLTGLKYNANKALRVNRYESKPGAPFPIQFLVSGFFKSLRPAVWLFIKILTCVPKAISARRVAERLSFPTDRISSQLRSLLSTVMQ